MIKTNTTYEAWKNAMRYVMQEGKDFKDKDGRICREVMNMKIEILNPVNDITSPVEKVSNSKDWVYPRLDEIANVTLTRKYSPGHIYIYGQRIFDYDKTINQIDKFVVPLLNKDQKTRRAVVSLWNPKIDSNIFNKEVPSLITLGFNIVNNKINITAIIRSNNLFFGFPANIYQIFLLQEYVCQRISLDIGTITVFMMSAHIFDDKFDKVRDVIA